MKNKTNNMGEAMDKIKKINNKITEYLENRKEAEAHFQELEELVKRKTQAYYIHQAMEEKQHRRSRKKAGKVTLNKLPFSINIFKNKKKEIVHTVIPPKKIRSIKLPSFNFSKIHNSIKNIRANKQFQPNVENLQGKLKRERKVRINKKVAFGSAAFLLIIAVSFVYMLESITAYEVTFNGNNIGLVKNPESVMALIDVIDEKLDGEYGADIIISRENLSFTRIRRFGMELSEEADILNHFSYLSGYEAKAYSVDIDGEQIAVFSKKEEAERLLEEIKSVYVHENENTKYNKVYFLENVAIKETETDVTSFSNYEETLRYVLKGTNEERLYKVQKGENYWTIAAKHNIKPEDLEAANPNVKPEKLQIGQEISLIVPKPLVTVVTVENQTYLEKIPFDITYENTGALFKGENEIKLKGKNGQKEVLAEVEKQNGIEVSRIELESKVIENPKTQIVLVGTKALPPLIGTGTFNNPTRGTLTSKFGTRWGRMHSGIDIAGPVGTAIRAADGGVVTYTGWKGNYGLAVIIDHGQNKSTLYAHNSKILVKVGDKVYQGQKIAEMGNTGNSTGPHLHFEVQVNGVAKNPLNYVSY